MKRGICRHPGDGFGFPAATWAQDAIPWTPEEVVGWRLAVDPSLAAGCFTYNVFEEGTLVRLGFNSPNGTSYLMLGHMDWSPVEEGKSYDITLQLETSPPGREQRGVAVRVTCRC